MTCRWPASGLDHCGEARPEDGVATIRVAAFQRVAQEISSSPRLVVCSTVLSGLVSLPPPWGALASAVAAVRRFLSLS